MQAVGCGLLVEITKPFRRAARLISADPDGHHVAFAQPRGQIKHLSGGFRPEVADGIKDPQMRNPKVALPALAPALHALKERLHGLPSPAYHSDAHVNFGMH